MKKKNFLEFIPVRNNKNTWEEDGGAVVINVENKGFYCALARLLRRTPRVSHIHLDEYGSFIWRRIDGKNSVGELAGLIKAEYGNDAEPLYNRLVKYMRILSESGFIKFREVK